MTVSEQTVLDTDFDGDKLEMIVLVSTQKGHFDFQDSGSASLEACEVFAKEPWEWCSGTSHTNPLAGNPVDTLRISNASSSSTAAFKIGVLYNSDA